MQTTGDRFSQQQHKGAQAASDGTPRPRVYEVAKDMGLSNKELVDKIRGLGIEIKNHMSSLEPDDVARVKRALDKERQENTVVERIQPTVIRRRNKAGEGHAAAPTTPPPAQVAKATPPPAAPPPKAERREVASGVVRRHVEAPPPPAAPPVRSEPPAPAPQERVVASEPEVEAPVRKRVKAEAPAPAAVVEAKAPPEPPREEVREAAPPPPPVEVKPAPPVAEVSSSQPAPKAAKAKEKEPEVMQDVPPPAAPRAPVPAPPPVMATPLAPVVAAPAAPPAADKPRQKTQFEIELERARDASAAKQAAAAAQRAAEPAPAAPAVSGRPAVGSIIELPLPRIQITERGPGGRPLPAGRTAQPQTTIPGAGQVRGRFADSQRGGARRTDPRTGAARKTVMAPGKKARSTQITTPAEHKRIIKMDESIAVSELAHAMGLKATEVLKKLWGMGMLGVTINQSIDFDTASILTGEFGYEVQSTAFQETAVFDEGADAPEDLISRAPVVTIMGHVDHGKTSLLDAIRHTDVAAGESGGITQHIGAYRISAPNVGDVVFLDTPGHAAFTAMRARGAQATDVVILVVAADDGAMPQTLEALSHAKDAEVPIIVAVNKIDKPGATPDRIRQQLSEHGLLAEEWGGETMFVNTSAYTKVGIDKLLESIQLQAEMLELKANPKKLAKGVIIEAKLDRNRGPMATVLVQDGTLRVGDTVVSGEHMGKVRAMLNDRGATLTEAGPSTPVEILGLDGVPEAGDVLNSVDDEKAAKTVIEHRRDSRRKKELASTGKLSLENVLEKINEGNIKELKIVLKTDVQGSAEALREALVRLATAEVKVNVIHTGVGGITESDVNLAKAGNAIVIGFHVRPAGKAHQLAEQEGVDIKLYEIIYDAIEDVKKAMVGLLAPVKREKMLGKAEVRQVFVIPKLGAVAGSMVTEGKIARSSLIRVVREAVQVYAGKLGSLKRFKDDVREVEKGYECGFTVDGFNDLKEGDIVEAYEIVEEAATL
jgi:translation initiation factor IF-2